MLEGENVYTPGLAYPEEYTMPVAYYLRRVNSRVTRVSDVGESFSRQ